MELTSNVHRGLLLARSLPILFNPPSILLDLLTHEGERIKIVAAKIDLPADIVSGNYYKFTNLLPRKIHGFDHVVYQLKHADQIEREEAPPDQRIPCVDHQYNYDFHGKITAVDKVFCMYEVNNSNTLVLSYVKRHCKCPTLEVGDEVEVKMAHRFCDRWGKDYYVLCLRGYIHVRSSNNSQKSKSDPISLFVQLVETYGLNLQCLLWLRENLDVIKTCLKDTFLTSIGLSNINVVYADVLMMLLSSNEMIAEKIRSAPHQRSVVREFFTEPHSCLPVEKDLQLPPKPMSISNCLQSMLEMDVPVNDRNEWNFNISETQDNRPILAYIAISKQSHRLCLTDGCGQEATIALTREKRYPKTNCSCLNGKIVLVEKPILVVEKYLEDNEIDPAALYVNTTKDKFLYLMTDLDNVRILGPDKKCFPEWTKITVTEFVKQNDCGAKEETLIPLQENSAALDSYIAERYVILHKTPLETSSINEIRTYLMVRSAPTGNVAIEAGQLDSTSYVFLELRRSHAKFYNLIPFHGEIEIRFPKDKANYIKRRRSTIPGTMSLQSKLKTTQSVLIPKEVEIYAVDPCLLRFTDVYSIAEAVTNPTFGRELVSIVGTVVGRRLEKGKFERERGSKRFSNDKNYGLPGLKSVLVLDLKNPITSPSTEGIGARVYISWLQTHQYPLGVLPGAIIALNFVYKAESNSKIYLRSTSLSSFEILEAAKPTGCNLTTFVDVPTAPWLFPHELSEGASAWCMIDTRHLTKLEIEAVCKQCGGHYARGVCSYPGCSSPLGLKLKASAQIILDNLGYQDTLFVNGENVRVLLQVSGAVWNSLLVLADRTGGLKYYRKDDDVEVETDEVDSNSTPEQVFTEFCRNVINGGQYHCYCRRFKTSGRTGFQFVSYSRSELKSLITVCCLICTRKDYVSKHNCGN